MFIAVEYRKYEDEGVEFWAATLMMPNYIQFTTYGDTQLEAVEKLPEGLLMVAQHRWNQQFNKCGSGEVWQTRLT